MSLQAIAGVAFDRRNPTHAGAIIARQAAETAAVNAGSAGQRTADRVNAALETLKRYIPTELLAIYLPFVAVLQDHYTKSPADLTSAMHFVYLGFVAATPFVVILIFAGKAAAAAVPLTFSSLPYTESVLGLLAFAIWGASVPGVFEGQQWWLGLAALASSVLLPLLDNLISPKAPGQ